eukprot:UN18307
MSASKSERHFWDPNERFQSKVEAFKNLSLETTF